MRIATIDVGTNTALLLVSEVTSGCPLVQVHQEQRFVRLGKGVDADRVIQPEGMERLKTTLLAYQAHIQHYGVEQVVVAGTSACRDARNRDELVDFVRSQTGMDLEILTGEDEAEWSFLGALSSFPPGDYQMLDIGGGSTELVQGESGIGSARISYRCSLDIGSVRLTERFLSRQPAPETDWDRARAHIDRMVELLERPAQSIPLVGAAGTASSLGLLHTGRGTWDDVGTQPVILSRSDVQSWKHRLAGLSYDEVLALNAEVLGGRADVFPMGTAILDAVMDHLDAPELLISARGLRHGLALRALARL